MFHFPSLFFFLFNLFIETNYLFYRVFYGLEFADCLFMVALNMFLFPAFICCKLDFRSKGLIRFRFDWRDHSTGDDVYLSQKHIMSIRLYFYDVNND